MKTFESDSKRFSNFLPHETTEALIKYSNAYRFRIKGQLPKSILNEISNPFNLMIFAETYEHEGDISATEPYSTNVLFAYFDRKQDSVLKRPIKNFTPNVAMNTLSQLAERVAVQQENRLSGADILNVLREMEQIEPEDFERVILFLTSERILGKETVDQATLYRFRHNRFIEYLFAYSTSQKLAKSGDPGVLEVAAKICRGNKILSLLPFHDNVSAICKSKFPTVYNELTDYFSKSDESIKNMLQGSRSEISHGGKTSTIMLDSLEKGIRTTTGENAWEGFFVISAKSNSQSCEKIKEFFCAAWDKNLDKIDRWKLIQKIGAVGDPLNEQIVCRVIQSEHAQDWLVFFDAVIESEAILSFSGVWQEIHGDEYLSKSSINTTNEDWARVRWVLSYLLASQRYPIGEV